MERTIQYFQWKDEGPESLVYGRFRAFHESGRLDLNQRPLAPQASALPGCATPRHRSYGGERRNRRSRSRQRASALQADLLRAFFSTCEGRNVSTRRAEISISWPVCGLRPTRDFFSRTTKLPNPESLIFSPRSSVSFKVSNTISTISADSFLENPTLLHTLSMTSALVMRKEYTGGANSVKPQRKRRSGAGFVTHCGKPPSRSREAGSGAPLLASVPMLQFWYEFASTYSYVAAMRVEKECAR